VCAELSVLSCTSVGVDIHNGPHWVSFVVYWSSSDMVSGWKSGCALFVATCYISAQIQGLTSLVKVRSPYKQLGHLRHPN
jgi:hypothetical protein